MIILSERIKPTIEDLQQRMHNAEETALIYKTRLEETIRNKPMRATGIVFAIGTVLGILLGMAVSKRR